MGKLFLLPFFILANFLCAFGQNAEINCPEISLVGIPNGYMGRGEQYFLSLAMGKSDSYDLEKLKYEWSFSENIPIGLQGKPYIYFIAEEQFDGVEVKATVKIEGLPEKCENTFSDTFKIQFNPGTPITLESYAKLSFSEERRKLDNVVLNFKGHSNENAMAFFIIRYNKKAETKLTLKKRLLAITNYLMMKHKFSKDRFSFVLVADDESFTQVYLVPKDKGFEKYNWEEDLEKAFIKVPKNRRNDY